MPPFCVNEQATYARGTQQPRTFFGYSSAEAIGKSCYFDSYAGEETSVPRFALQRFYAVSQQKTMGTMPNFDLEVTTRSGRRIWVDLSTLIFKNGRTHPRQLARDITKRKQKEELLDNMLQLSRSLQYQMETAWGMLRLSHQQ